MQTDLTDDRGKFCIETIGRLLKTVCFNWETFLATP